MTTAAQRLADDPKRKVVQGSDVYIHGLMNSLRARAAQCRIRSLANREAQRAAEGLARRLGDQADRWERQAGSLEQGAENMAAEVIVRTRAKRVRR